MFTKELKDRYYELLFISTALRLKKVTDSAVPMIELIGLVCKFGDIPEPMFIIDYAQQELYNEHEHKPFYYNRELAVIYRLKGMGISDLARRLGWHPQTCYNAVAEYKSKEYTILPQRSRAWHEVIDPFIDKYIKLLGEPYVKF